jgi:dienelactone hydrolase
MTRLLPLWLALSLAVAARAGDDPVTAALGREIIGPRQTLAEVQEFAAERIPAMPSVQSAEEWTRTADRLREDTLAKVIFRGEAAAWRDAKARVEWLDAIGGGPGYRIKKLRYEAVPGLWVPALLYEPERIKGKVPVVLNVNGHDPKGKAADYKQVRCINQAKRGMIALNVEWFGMGQLRGQGFRHGLINAIDLCGTGGIATHFLSMRRALDILLAHEHADPRRVAVTGLSGGGWQTIFISSLDPRVTLTNPVAGYSSFLTRDRHFSDLGDSEQTPCDLATVVDYAHLTAMMAPRPTLLTFNAKDDCCFAAGHALPPLQAAAGPIFRLFGKPGNLAAHVNFDPGTHNYFLDNRQACYQMMADAWSDLGTVYNPREIPSDGEVRTAEALNVELPSDNADFHHLAVALSKSLPRPAGPGGPKPTRERLHALVRPYDAEAKAEKVEEEDKDGISITSWRFHQGRTWTIPGVELWRDGAKGTVILVADAGRKGAAGLARTLVDSGKRVIAVDPFYFGESQVKERAYLFALLLGAVGERPLGVQAGQLMAIARWSLDEHADGPATIVAVGPRTGTIALVAAALEEKAIAGVELHDPLASLKEVIERGDDYTKSPELFCFGLLESFDLKQIAALVAPRPVKLEGASDRARSELSATAR